MAHWICDDCLFFFSSSGLLIGGLLSGKSLVEPAGPYLGILIEQLRARSLLTTELAELQLRSRDASSDGDSKDCR